MPTALHLFDGRRATWSALAALGALTGTPTAGALAHEVEALGGAADRTRARRAGIDLRDGKRAHPSTIRCAISWDDRAEALRRRRGLTGRRAPEPIPVDRARLVQRARARAALCLSPGQRAVAILDSSQGGFTPSDAAVFAAVLGLAGLPASVVIVDGTTPTDADRIALEKICAGASVQAPTEPPWVTLPACDLAVLARPVVESCAIARDLAAWSWAAGTPVVAPAGVDGARADRRQRRYAAARAVVRALTGKEAAPLLERADTTEPFEAWLDRFVESISTG